MPLRVSGKNISVGMALQQRISGRVEEATAKYFRGGYSGFATVGKDGFGFRTECVLHLDSGASIEAEGLAPDAYDSADQAAGPHRKEAAALQAPPQGQPGPPRRLIMHGTAGHQAHTAH